MCFFVAEAAATSRRNERRVFGRGNGIVFARRRPCHPHRARGRNGNKSALRSPKNKSPSPSLSVGFQLASYPANLSAFYMTTPSLLPQSPSVIVLLLTQLVLRCQQRCSRANALAAQANVPTLARSEGRSPARASLSCCVYGDGLAF